MGNTYLVYLLQSQIHSVFSVFGGAGGSNTRPRCMLCICFKVKYTVYLVYLEVCAPGSDNTKYRIIHNTI